MSMKSLATLFASLMLCSAAALAADWDRLGSRTVNDRAEYDTIAVGADRGTFAKLRFGIKGARVEVKRMVVHFADDSTQTFERNRIVEAGERSEIFDLKGGNRRIRKVVFYYETRTPGRKQATIALYGRR